MKTTSIVLIALVMALTGCTTVRNVDLNNSDSEASASVKRSRVVTYGKRSRVVSYAERQQTSYATLNRKVRGKQVTVLLADGRELKVSSLQVTPDSTSWMVVNTERFESVASSPTLGPPTYSITLTDGRQLYVNDLQVADDSTSWIDPSTRYSQAVATAQVKTISYKVKVTSEGVSMRTTVPPEQFDPTTVPPDSTSWMDWMDVNTERFESVATAEIREVRVASGGGGRFIGAIAGMIIGGAAGVAHAASKNYYDDPRLDCTLKIGISGLPDIFGLLSCGAANRGKKTAREKARSAAWGFGAGGVLLGGALGATFGSAVKRKDIYRFKAPTRAPQVAADGTRRE